MLATILNRLKEPSTYAGLSGIVLGATGWSQGQFDAVTALIIGIASVIAMFLPEAKKP
jgi:hypothetical protein